MALKSDLLFFSPNILVSPDLPASESEHVVRVLRKKEGDTIDITNGKGAWVKAQITEASTVATKVRIIEVNEIVDPLARQVTIAIAPTKNPDRIEYFVEKAVEIGVSNLFFVQTQHTVAKRLNEARIQKIAISAMKQSLKTYLPAVTPLLSFSNFLERSAEYKQKLAGHLDETACDLFQTKLEKEVLIFIGPEGDFSQEELTVLEEKGFQKVFFGKSRLRTETAGVVAASLLTLIP